MHSPITTLKTLIPVQLKFIEVNLDITVKVYHRFGAKFTTRMELL